MLQYKIVDKKVIVADFHTIRKGFEILPDKYKTVDFDYLKVKNSELYFDESLFLKDSQIKKSKEVSLKISNHIYNLYFKDKQSQDLMWTNYHRTNLVAQGVTDIEAQIVGFVLEVEGGKKLSTALKNVNADQKPAFEKLVKIGLRTAWAKKCIDEGLSAMAEGREPNYPPFPSFEA